MSTSRQLIFPFLPRSYRRHGPLHPQHCFVPTPQVISCERDHPLFAWCFLTEELVPEEELRTRIMRWRIEKTDVGIDRRGLEDDDIYDF